MAYFAVTVKDMMTMHDFFLFFYFIKWYISLNVPKKKGGGMRLGGVRGVLEEVVSITFFSSYFLHPSLPPYVISSLPLYTTKDQISWWVLCVLYPFDNRRWCILIRQSPPAPGNGTCHLGTRQDGCDRARHVEAHRPTLFGSVLRM